MSGPRGSVLQVSVAIALPGWQAVLPLELGAGATVADALRAARPLAELSGMPAGSALDWEQCAVGIFGVACARGDVLQAGDRVELYRPLRQDPKESRRRRAADARRAAAGTRPPRVSDSGSGGRD